MKNESQIPIQKSEWIVIGGGDSVTKEDVELARKWREEDEKNRGVIAVTKSYCIAPWADIIHARDRRFWKKLYDDVVEKSDGYKISWQDCSDLHSDIHKLQYDRLKEGGNSGFQSIIIAMQAGAKIIYLLGIDMQHTNNKTHWHNGYPDGLGNSLSKLGTMGSVFKRWMLQFDKLKCDGVKIINCSMPSKLTCFPKRSLQKAIAIK